MENKQYTLDDFKELLDSREMVNVMLGLTMLKASIPFKSMTSDELHQFESQFRAYEFRSTSRSLLYGNFTYSDFYNLKGKILVKINNCLQKLEKNERQRRNKIIKEV